MDQVLKKSARQRQSEAYWKKRRMTVREGEQVGGGLVVFRRGYNSKRIHPAPVPFEHGDYEKALAEAQALAKDMPGASFSVFMEVARVTDGNIVERG